MATPRPAARKPPKRSTSNARAAPTRTRSDLFDRLGVFGLGALEPVVLAALATEAPLLLIGPHGTAKSHLLLRLSEGLGLSYRHYNASLLNFDDLVGYPLPDASGNLEFVKTPASVWGAGVVFLDEISRCRPDMQNRLFSIVHERRVQGLPLPDLRHRWAAMNPPAKELDDPGAEPVYAGSEPLDPALADRFPFVALMPGWEDFDEDTQDAILRLRTRPVASEAGEALRGAVARVREDIEGLEQDLAEPVSGWVRALTPLLGALDLALSPRRAAMLFRNAIALHAARANEAGSDDPGESAWLALRCSLPQRAEGREIDEGKLFLAHREAWAAACLDRLDPRRQLMRISDPVKRAVRATGLAGLDVLELSAHVADGLAAAPLGARHALALHVAGSAAAGRLTAHVAEQVADLQALALAPRGFRAGVHVCGEFYASWKTLTGALAALRDPTEERLLTNVVMALLAAGQLDGKEKAMAAVSAWKQVRTLCAGEAS